MTKYDDYEHCPTQEEIRQACQEIQKEWNPIIRCRRETKDTSSGGPVELRPVKANLRDRSGRVTK